MSVIVYSKDDLDELSAAAVNSPRARMHRNLHADYQDPCQRLFNAIGQNSYIPPHRHLADPKQETLLAVCGLFGLLTFDDRGTVTGVLRFGSEKYAESADVVVCVELSPNTWHTVVALVPGCILLEIKEGPFDPRGAKELAPWAPGEHESSAPNYLERLKAIIVRAFTT